MKVLVLGAGGMAGHVIATRLREAGHDVTTVSARNKLDHKTVLIDVTQPAALNKFLDENEFDFLINSIGILVKMSEDRKDLASYLNSYLPHQLEHRYSDTNTKIIHLSTDCVFSGENAPYNESSVYDGKLFYDRSKALGEIINDKDLTLRMSIIGPDMQKNGTGLFNWFFSQTGNVNGYTSAIWNGVTTIVLADAIIKAMEKNIHGLYHLVPNDNISKFNLLNIFKNVFDRNDITLCETEGVSVDKTLINTRDDFVFEIPTYPNMIKDMKKWIDKHRHLYPHYQ